MIYWGHVTVDLGDLQAGLGASWTSTGALLGLSLHPKREHARTALSQTEPSLDMESAPLPTDLHDQLQDALAGEWVEWTWSPQWSWGTPFQKRVWQELMRCPHGETWSYSDLARRMGKPTAARAVGGACGRNPFPLRIPCHRIIAADGSLGGFTGDLEVKRWLLMREACLSQDPDSSPNDNALL